MFQRFASLTRFSHDWTITEKIDGTNACLFVAPTEEVKPGAKCVLKTVGDLHLIAQSRNKIITPGDDNAGFAAWAAMFAEQLIETLGEGRHFGEWCGAGIQRRYGLPMKKFALFNTHRWGALSGHSDGGLLGGQITVVPTLAAGYMDNPGQAAIDCMETLRQEGSKFAPGFMDPEGVVMRHNPSGTVFKKTFDYDEQGEWAENQARKNSA